MRRFMLATLILPLAGCSSLLPQGAPAPQHYTLQATDVALKTGQHLPYQLEIQQPQLKPGLDNDRIAVRRTPNRLNYFADTRWAGELKDLLQSQLVASFDQTEALQAVGNDLVSMHKDYGLLLDVQAFEVMYADGPPMAHLRYTAKLIRLRDKMIVSTKLYEATQSAETNKITAIISALNTAWQQTSSQMINDCIQVLSRQ